MYLVLFIGILEVFTTWEGVCIAHLPIIQIIGSGCLSKASYRCTKQILYMEYYSFYCGSRPFLKSEIKITMMQVQHLNNLSIYSLYSICGAVCFKSQDTCALLSFWTLLCKSCSQKLWKLKFCSGLACLVFLHRNHILKKTLWRRLLASFGGINMNKIIDQLNELIKWDCCQSEWPLLQHLQWRNKEKCSFWSEWNRKCVYWRWENVTHWSCRPTNQRRVRGWHMRSTRERLVPKTTAEGEGLWDYLDTHFSEQQTT